MERKDEWADEAKQISINCSDGSLFSSFQQHVYPRIFACTIAIDHDVQNLKNILYILKTFFLFILSQILFLTLNMFKIH